MCRICCRRFRAPSSRANTRARPTCPCETLAAYAASSGSTPSRVSSNRATAEIVGVCSVKRRQRDRMVATTSSGVGAHRIHTVRGAGSSMLFSKASAPRSVTRSASSMTITCQPAESRTHRRSADQLAHLVHADREQFGTDQGDVWMRTGQRRTAGTAVPAATRVTLQRRGKCSGGIRPAGAWRTGEQPGVAHGVRLTGHRTSQGGRRPRSCPISSAQTPRSAAVSLTATSVQPEDDWILLLCVVV